MACLTRQGAILRDWSENEQQSRRERPWTTHQEDRGGIRVQPTTGCLRCACCSVGACSPSLATATGTVKSLRQIGRPTEIARYRRPLPVASRRSPVNGCGCNCRLRSTRGHGNARLRPHAVLQLCHASCSIWRRCRTPRRPRRCPGGRRASHPDSAGLLETARTRERPLIVLDAAAGRDAARMLSLCAQAWRDPILLSEALAEALVESRLQDVVCRLCRDGRAASSMQTGPPPDDRGQHRFVRWPRCFRPATRPTRSACRPATVVPRCHQFAGYVDPPQGNDGLMCYFISACRRGVSGPRTVRRLAASRRIADVGSRCGSALHPACRGQLTPSVRR
jgi:hypothetical protein